MFSSEQCVPQESNTSFKITVAITLCFQLCSAHYKVLQMKNSRRSASATIQSPRKYDDSYTPTISCCLENAAAIMLHFQLFSACYTALKMKNCVTIVFAINLVSKEKLDTKEDKGKSMMHVLYILRYAKRNVSGQSNVEQ